MKLPQPRTKIRVEVANARRASSLVWQPQTLVFEGEVVPCPNYWDEPHLALTTGIPQFPIRYIPVSSIVKLGDQAVERKSVAAEKPQAETWTITGSKGNTYVVTHRNGNWKCDCPAGTFGRKVCKHIKQAQETKLKAS